MHLLVMCLLCLISNLALAAPLKVTFVNPGYQGERFWDMVTSTMHAAADNLDIHLEVLYAQRDRHAMQALARTSIKRESPPDYLILVNEEQQGIDLLETAESHGVDVLMLLNGPTVEQRHDTGLPGERFHHWIGMIEPDNHAAGARMAQALIDAAPSEVVPLPTLALIGDALTPASISRNGGMLETFRSAPHVRLDRILIAHWNSEEARELTKGYLRWLARRQETPALIWAANDSIAIGAIDALQAEGFTPGDDVMVVGLNWSPEGIERVRRGDMLLTDGGHFLAGAWAMVMLRDHADGHLLPTDAHVTFQMAALDTDTVNQLGEQLADPDWSRIDFTRFRRSGQSDDSVYHFSPRDALDMLMGPHP